MCSRNAHRANTTPAVQNVWCSVCVHSICVCICVHERPRNSAYYSAFSACMLVHILLRYWPWFHLNLICIYLYAGKSTISTAFLAHTFDLYYTTCVNWFAHDVRFRWRIPKHSQHILNYPASFLWKFGLLFCCLLAHVFSFRSLIDYWNKIQ